ncbi:uncharacterized protein STEHIDRAFT_159181 [Stereum hirsutum FP-91666 SS1]|uniref:uncharacterized protein n=1 Tax=Stereum hirsutum (strain FP-91666) TaxID=721885 RepID=UPI000444A528|nr:uncharacterized protein STEHIDRAFT_159181 [Stereum hirsutum FP-91666 SS1]EIM84510.1 hypothetical protein STEHIDRAFT_159181 [Stereum hirsutum FP-91666 SS1]
MNPTSYQHPGQTGRATMGQQVQNPGIWGLEPQTNALGNFASTAQHNLYSQAPQHAAQQVAQPYYPLPTPTGYFDGHMPNLGGQVRTSVSFVVKGPMLTSCTVPHLEPLRSLQSLPDPSPYRIRPTYSYDTSDWDLRQLALPPIRIASSSRGTGLNVPHTLGHRRQIMPLPSRAAPQNIEPITHIPGNPPAAEESMTINEFLDFLEQSSKRVDRVLENIGDSPAGTSSTPQSAYPTASSSSGTGSSFPGTPLDPMLPPDSLRHAQYGYDEYDFLFHHVDLSSFLDYPRLDRSSSSRELRYDADGALAEGWSAPPPKRKSTASSTQGREKRTRKDDPQKPIGSDDSTRSTAPQVQHDNTAISEASTSQDVPTSDDAFLSRSGVNAGTTTPAEEETREKRRSVERVKRVKRGSKDEPHSCMPEKFGRQYDYRRHFCTSPHHEAERSIPGWKQRHGIPDDFSDGLVFCQFVDCELHQHGVRKDVLKKHLWKRHRIGEPPRTRTRTRTKKC